MKYSFNIQASDGETEQNEKLIISAFNNESGSHIALKLIAYLMFIKRRPRIDEDAGWQVVPDLIARDDSGAITLWIDCGTVSAKKADTIATKVRDSIEFFVFRRTEREMDQFYKQIQDKVKHLKNVKCIGFDEGFIDGIGEALDRTNNLEAYVSDEMITVNVDNSFGKHEGYSAIHRIVGE
ncbi:MAG: YaeQ family protein [Candidatus Obscuribacterales bacterium]|nr:YaeQ family protein [Candidatus Obscuribacterales bacterium]